MSPLIFKNEPKYACQGVSFCDSALAEDEVASEVELRKEAARTGKRIADLRQRKIWFGTVTATLEPGDDAAGHAHTRAQRVRREHLNNYAYRVFGSSSVECDVPWKHAPHVWAADDDRYVLQGFRQPVDPDSMERHAAAFTEATAPRLTSKSVGSADCWVPSEATSFTTRRWQEVAGKAKAPHPRPASSSATPPRDPIGAPSSGSTRRRRSRRTAAEPQPMAPPSKKPKT